jgi:hypothetical protein
MVTQTRSYLGWVRQPRPSTYQEVRLVVKSDARLQDPQVLDEIELYGELVIAASASEEPLSRDEIDRVLGLEHPDEGEAGSV